MFRFNSLLSKCRELNSWRRLSTLKREYKEVSIKVPWGQISGKWWEPYDVRPLLTLHGWQDNCGSFDRLIPMLDRNVGFLSIDLPGHGYSSWLPPGIFYHFNTYLLTIMFIKNYFKWAKISLMGHSLGGIISYSYSMLFPSQVDFVMCIDGAKPMTRVKSDEYIAKELTRFVRYNSFVMDNKEPPAYTLDKIKELVCAPNNNSIHPDVVHHLLLRMISPSKEIPGKYYITRDPRLKSSETGMFLQSDLVEWAQNFTMPIFMAKVKGTTYYEAKENFCQVLDVIKRTSVDCDFRYIGGTHHSHLNNPENVAGLVSNFIRRHDVGDRSEGGITDEIIIEKQESEIQV